MEKVLFTGSNGLLGIKFTDFVIKNKCLQLVATSKGANRHEKKSGYIYESLDITNAKEVRAVIEKHQPNSIIHAAAMTHVDACELDKETCMNVNVHATRHICNAARDIGAHVVFISTDFVFDGTADQYTENDEPNPLSHYAQSKYEAEKIVQQANEWWAILRTSLVFGILRQDRLNIVTWIKKSLEEKKKINIINDQWRMPTLAEDLAKACYLSVKEKKKGIYNITGKDLLRIDEIAYKVAEYWKLDTSLISLINSEALNQPAQRPRRTAMVLDKAMTELDYQPHSFEEALKVIDNQLKLL